MPPKKVSGMLMTSAQGQLMTRKVSARVNHTDHCPANSGGTTASASAAKQTAGV